MTTTDGKKMDIVERPRPVTAPKPGETLQEQGHRIAVDLLEGYGPDTMVGVVCRALLERPA